MGDDCRAMGVMRGHARSLDYGSLQGSASASRVR